MANTWEPVDALAPAPANLAATPQMTVNWDLFKALPNFDLRNGAIEDVESVLVRSTIPVAYHWVPIIGLPAEMAVNCLDAFIRSHMVHIRANRPNDLQEGDVRKVAIALGTMRAAATTFFRLNPADVIPGELAAPMLTAYSDGANGVRYAVFQGNATAVTHTAELTAALELTDQEKNVIGQLVKCGAGVIPMQGYSLTMTNHHYLSDAGSQSRKVFAVAERAMWVSQSIGDWFSSCMLTLQDVCWHKSTHPINMAFKVEMAMDPEIAKKLTIAGIGACASRLPAVEPALRTANSYITLMATVNTLLKICGGEVNYSTLTNMVEIVKSFPNRTGERFDNPLVPATLREVLVDRKSAIKMLDDMLAANLNTVAWCFGFYVAQSDDTAMLTTTRRNDTLKTSFSLTKLQSQSGASYTGGMTAYADYASARNRQRQEGKYVAPRFLIE